jgi:hypothetical protein
MQIIGISGKAGSGKDYLTQKFFRPDGFFQFSLAWHFKVWLVAKGEATYEEVFITKPPHVRKMLQLEGTEFGRLKYGEDVWCQSVLTWFRVFNESWGVDKFVIPDVRFPNEVEFIKKNGGKVYRIIAPTRVANSSLNEEARKHISETALDEYPLDQFDGLIFNDPEYSETVGSQISLLRGSSANVISEDSGEFEVYDESTVKTFFKDVKDLVNFWHIR